LVDAAGALVIASFLPCPPQAPEPCFPRRSRRPTWPLALLAARTGAAPTALAIAAALLHPAHQGFEGQQLLRILLEELLGISAAHLVGAIDQKQQSLGLVFSGQLGLCLANQGVEGLG